MKSVFILGASAKASVAVIESCRSAGYEIWAGASSRHCCGLYTKGVQRKIIYPSVSDHDACYSFLLEFVQREKPNIILPCGDEMTDLIARHQKELSSYSRMVLPSYDNFKKGRNKIDTLKIAKIVGCPIPKTWYPEEESINAIADQITSWPVLIKPAVSAGSRGIRFCHTKETLVYNYNEIRKLYGSTFVQDFIPTGGTQYKADIIMDGSQRVLANVVYAKLRFYPPDAGSSVLNMTVKRPDIIDHSIRIMHALEWQGICDFDYIVDPRDGLPKLMEINPRFPESYRATLSGGVDMTRMLCDIALGKHTEPELEYAEGRYLRFLFGDIMWFLTTKENRFSTTPSFFKFFSKDVYYQLIRKNDPGPLIGYVLENLFLLFDMAKLKKRLRLSR